MFSLPQLYCMSCQFHSGSIIFDKKRTGVWVGQKTKIKLMSQINTKLMLSGGPILCVPIWKYSFFLSGCFCRYLTSADCSWTANLGRITTAPSEDFVAWVPERELHLLRLPGLSPLGCVTLCPVANFLYREPLERNWTRLESTLHLFEILTIWELWMVWDF